MEELPVTISVINATMLCRQEVQDKIRAVNRQLQDDFRRYWHADVHLRLEGWTGEAPIQDDRSTCAAMP
ncbi:MAG: hypothetical protein OXJ90_14860 [Spirochaetaceae bacterium]|nr:hypothetical protein [Spirochaetaceae bacterium]